MGKATRGGQAKLTAPFPYAGGKSRVAAVVWRALGQPAHYLEPFFGSGAVLLNRPAYDPQKYTETICDADGYVSNVWRALQADPDAVARICDRPVNHADLMAVNKYLMEHYEGLLERLTADIDYYDVRMAGFWVWAAAQWIGQAEPMIDGVRPSKGRPHLTGSGQGVTKKSLRARGKVPHLAGSGRGVTKKSLRAASRDESLDVRAPYTPALYPWFRELSERLRYVRVVCGDWKRVCGGKWQSKMGMCGVFFDPPYSAKAGRHAHLYNRDSLTVAGEVAQWAVERGTDPKYRIVLAGYYEEHDWLLAEGWRVYRWTAGGGYANTARKLGAVNDNRNREALFMSPHCLRDESLWD